MSGFNEADIAAIIAQWGLKAFSWEKIKDVYKVQTDQGVKNLKVSPLIPQRLLFVHQAVKHLAANGFTKMYPLIPTLSGSTYLSGQTAAYSLFDWIEGRQCDFSNSSELAEATKVLAFFHQRSAGFIHPDNSNMRNRLGRCLEHFEEGYRQLLKYQEIARIRPNDRFAQVYLENVPFFLPLAEQAIIKLKKSCYTKLVTEAKLSKVFCHGDPAARNFILTPTRTIYLIDFDSCRLDLPIMDVIKFARRILKKHHWRFRTIQLLIDSYQEVQPFSPGELDVMKAVFYFPQKFWRMANRYFEEHQSHTPEEVLHKFQKFLQNKKAFGQFQVDFENYR